MFVCFFFLLMVNGCDLAVPPIFAFHNQPHALICATKQPIDGTHSLPRIKQFAHLHNLRLGINTFGMFGTNQTETVVLPALVPHIVNVLLLGSRKKMERINTIRTIASVTDLFSFGDFPKRQNKGVAMGKNLAPIDINCPISLFWIFISYFAALPLHARLF